MALQVYGDMVTCFFIIYDCFRHGYNTTDFGLILTVSLDL